MPIRTTAEAVAKINTDIDEDTAEEYLEPFIEVASELVDDWCATAVDDDGLPLYSDTRLELIERWLSAHFAALDDPKSTSDWIGLVRSTYETDKVDLGLKLTRYGQHALVLDARGGGLNSIDITGASVQLGIHWLGSYDDEVEEG